MYEEIKISVKLQRNIVHFIKYNITIKIEALSRIIWHIYQSRYKKSN